jgi:hypothetical protein
LRCATPLPRLADPLPKSGGDYGELANFFDALRLIDGLDLQYDFEGGGGPWLVVCQPDKSWRAVKDALAAKTAEIPLERKYKLSGDSLALLKWIVQLRESEYLQGMTPCVEERIEKEIGLSAKWDGSKLVCLSGDTNRRDKRGDGIPLEASPMEKLPRHIYVDPSEEESDGFGQCRPDGAGVWVNPQ